MKKLFFVLSAVIALQLSAEVLKQESYTKNMSNWRKPNYWGGTLEHVQDGKTKVIKLDATEKKWPNFWKNLWSSKTPDPISC